MSLTVSVTFSNEDEGRAFAESVQSPSRLKSVTQVAVTKNDVLTATAPCATGWPPATAEVSSSYSLAVGSSTVNATS